MLKIGLSHDRLIFNMGILIPGKIVFILRQGPGYQHGLYVLFTSSLLLLCLTTAASTDCFQESYHYCHMDKHCRKCYIAPGITGLGYEHRDISNHVWFCVHILNSNTRRKKMWTRYPSTICVGRNLSPHFCDRLLQQYIKGERTWLLYQKYLLSLINCNGSDPNDNWATIQYINANRNDFRVEKGNKNCPIDYTLQLGEIFP